MTSKQRQLLDYIEGFIQEKRYSPSLKEMGEAMGGKSVGTIHQYLKLLTKAGYLTRDGGARGYIVKK